MRVLTVGLLLVLFSSATTRGEAPKLPDRISELDNAKAHLFGEEQGRLEAEIRLRQILLTSVIEKRNNFLTYLRQTYKMSTEDSWDADSYIIIRKKAAAK